MDVARIYCRGLFLPKQMLNLVKGRSTVDARTTEARKELQDATGRPLCAIDTRHAVFKHNAIKADRDWLACDTDESLKREFERRLDDRNLPASRRLI